MVSATARPYIDASVPVLREHGLAITPDVAAAKRIMPNLHTATFYEDAADCDAAMTHAGRMDVSRLPAWSRNDADVYLCGPVGFMQVQWRALLDAGVPVTRLHREVFGPELLNYLD